MKDGITRKNNLVTVVINDDFVGLPGVDKAMQRMPNSLIVKNWKFADKGSNPDPVTNKVFPYVNIPTAQTGELRKIEIKDNVKVATSYDFKSADVTDETGLSGQNTANPASIFRDHCITFIDGAYYDPSYGRTYKDLADMEQQVIAGFSFLYFNRTNQTVSWVVRKPSAKLDDLNQIRQTYP